MPALSKKGNSRHGEFALGVAFLPTKAGWHGGIHPRARFWFFLTRTLVCGKPFGVASSR